MNCLLLVFCLFGLCRGRKSVYYHTVSCHTTLLLQKSECQTNFIFCLICIDKMSNWSNGFIFHYQHEEFFMFLSNSVFIFCRFEQVDLFFSAHLNFLAMGIIIAVLITIIWFYLFCQQELRCTICTVEYDIRTFIYLGKWFDSVSLCWLDITLKGNYCCLLDIMCGIDT